jgi:anthranilate synthase component I
MTGDEISVVGSESTNRDSFDAQLPDRRVIPVTRTFFADGETPTGIYRKLAHQKPGSFLLESAEKDGVWSRFSLVGVSSFGVLTEANGRSVWHDYGVSGARAFGGQMEGAPLGALEQLYARWRTPRIDSHPIMMGGLVGYIGWEAVRELERLLGRPPADFAVPTLALCFVADLVVVDHRYGTVQLIANVLNDGAHERDELWADAQQRLDSMQTKLAQPTEALVNEIDRAVAVRSTSRTPRAEYLDSVQKAKALIHDGEVFQVVVSQRFEHSVKADPLDVYRVLCSLNPSPYMYLLQLEVGPGKPFSIVGASPEALVKIQGDRVVTHPIAGSRPRGATPEEDLDFERAVIDDVKERAEHIMLVDLARNDLLKVCEPGSVQVPEFMRVERFSHVMHIVSTVEGRLMTGVSPIDVFRATFPAGTLSGAPKPRALEVIDELEPAQRGVYGGVVGYLGFEGDSDLAIAIRTATIIGDVAYVQAGGGIVADSDPETEFEESQNKAAAPLYAVALANTMRRVTSE